MYCAKLRLLWLSIATASIMTLSAQPSASQAIVADHNVIAQFDLISTATFDQVRSNYNIFYGHTSHGSQIMTGISMLAGEDALYSSPTFYEINDDLGHLGDISWVSPTRAYLDSHSECNVVMWSWCGGASDNTETGINTYLNAMAALESDYPTVTFVYMTGHLDGTGPSGNLYLRNNQIRDYCINNDKILFDFADIESYDPDGTWYPDESDVCNWCADWCAIHDCPYCGSCAHSHCFNCYQKGKAFWWMMAEVLGWEPEPCCEGRVGNINGDGGDEPTIGDISTLIDAKLITGTCYGIIECLEEADTNQSGGTNPTCDDITISDISVLIDYLFITGSSLGLAECL